MKEYTQQILLYLGRHKDTEVAKSMSKATKGETKFLGIKTTELKNIFKALFTTYPLPKSNDTKSIIREFFAMEEREYLYFGIELFAKRKKMWNKTDIVFVESLILTQPGWDTTEYIATELVSHFYEMFPKVTLEFLESWSASKSPWLKATAIMFQRKMKDKTDKELLGRFISENLGTSDEIINRSIGSALRDYSKTNHKWVLENVVQNSEKMNKKTKQEAIKWIDSKGLIK
ncbi:MAG: DNA alkylation repair protein [Bacteroidales bacterium]|nr:DNA alkylation repair protein [Bacteroidales bacterium]